MDLLCPFDWHLHNVLQVSRWMMFVSNCEIEKTGLCVKSQKKWNIFD